MHGDRLAARVDALLVNRAALAIRHVPAEPVVRARQLPGRVEVSRVGGERGGPEIRGAARTGQLAAIRVERVRRLRGETRDIE